ncbi:hypothetical protein Ais01nite_12300 [Asanoa ishikariensis]|nr:hypothetical protein Ais01nite_12300 [Asanoa ishikariensis]
MPLGSPQQVVLLAMLLLREGRPASVDEVTSALWDGDPPRAATSTIRTYVSRLRRVLDGTSATIETVGDGYALRVPEASVDVMRFRRSVARGRELQASGDAAGAAAVLAESLELWRGPALAGLPGRFAGRQRTRLEEGRQAADESRLSALLDAFPNQQAEAVLDLVAMVEAFPLREGPRLLLMRALHGSGRQGDALAVYREGRACLKDDLGLEPGPALRQLHERILRGDLTPATPSPDAVSGPTRLPHDLADFTGRETELAAISAGLLDGPGWVGIAGIDGIGRTATAVRAAHRLRDRFTGGQLYADVASSVDLADILATWLSAFDLPASDLPESVNGRLAMLHRAAAGRPLLIVLDNVDDPALLEPLLRSRPPGGLLMTTRRRHTELAAVWVTIGGLRTDDALVLLERMAGADRVASDRPAAERLTRLAWGWPLPLRLLGARLRDRPMWSIADIAHELDRELHNVTGVLHDECLAAEAPLVRAYDRLRPAQARALRLAAVIEQEEFTTQDVAALLAVSVGAAFSAIDPLVDLGLIGEAASPHSYRLHPIVRAFARRLAHTVEGTAGVTAARDRLSVLRAGADLPALESSLTVAS